MARPVASRWISVFSEFVKDLRISSKEVISDDPRGVPLVMWESQSRFLQELADGLDLGVRIFNCLKSRQLGITTVSLAVDVMWLAMHDNLTGAIVTDTEKNRDINRSMIERYVASFPPDYFGGSFQIVKANRQFIQFSNGSRLDLLVAGTKKKSSSWGEGVGYAFVHCTEIAAYGDEDGLKSFIESFAQKNPNRLFIFESTAKGFNHWRSRWYNGINNPYTERSFFIGWWASATNMIERSDPRFLRYGQHAASGEEREKCAIVLDRYGWKITREQLAWIRWREDNVGSDSQMLDQNQPWIPEDAFIQSGYSFFQSRVIGQDMKRIMDSPPELPPEGYGALWYKYELGSGFFEMKLRPVEDDENDGPIELRIWEEPQPNGRYVIGVDTAYGRNEHKDRSAISVWRCFADKLVQVAEFASSGYETNQFAWILAHLAGVYRDCIVNIEINGPGSNIMGEWANIRGQLNSDLYRDQVRSKDWEDALGWARWYLYHRPDSLGAGYAYNTLTTQKIGEQIMHGMRGCYVVGELEIRSLRLLHEMNLVVVSESGHIGANESKDEDAKDDRVYAAAFAIRAWQEWVKQDMLSQGLTYARVMEEERGLVAPVNRALNGIVSRFFMDQEERAANAEFKPTWRTDRGL